jgi:hypothetical protein
MGLCSAVGVTQLQVLVQTAARDQRDDINAKTQSPKYTAKST